MAKQKQKSTSLIKLALRRVWRWLLLGIAVFLLIVTSMRWINPVTSSVILQEQFLAMHYGRPKIVQYWVDWRDISAQMPLAVIASEDQRFPQHHGIDFTELSKAIRSGAHRGASTISQQVAKNMFLWQGRSYIRKALEAPIAMYIDLAWGKQRVLEIYLNIAYFGDNLYGVGAASEVYFDKPAATLNRHEAARLAAILPNPERYSAEHASSHTLERQAWILQQMKQLGGTNYLDQL